MTRLWGLFFTILILCALSERAFAEKPEIAALRPIAFTCDKQYPPFDDPHKSAGSKLTRLKCPEKVLKYYPFLESWTLKPVLRGTTYDFKVSKVTSSQLKHPMIIVNMFHPTVCKKGGCVGAYWMKSKDTFEWVPWSVKGVAAYTATCPDQFSLILEQPKKVFSRWVSNGTTFDHLANYNNIDAMPDCGAL
jgi:hypothetical protein